jgi:hypothetical protein
MAACSDPAPDPVELTDFSVQAADAVCDWATRCRHMPDRPTCERFIDPKSYDTRRAADAIAAGRMSYDAAAAGACLQATRDAYCLAVPFSDPSCSEMFVGLVAENGACTSDFECVGGGRCLNPSCNGQCCVGSCGPPITGTPPERADIGEPCETHDDCVENAHCGFDRICAERPDTEGEPCVFGCARGDLYCDLDDLVCKAYAGAGELCDPSGDTAPPCDEAWSYCDSVCKDRPGVGDPCGVQPQTCIPTAYCDNGTCKARGTTGDACSSNDQCDVACNTLSGSCVEYQTCEP